jgi:general secretion pathway protein G
MVAPHMVKRNARTAGKTRPHYRGEAGYSLMEVLIVLAIIAVIAALVGPRLFTQLDRAKEVSAGVQARALSAALETMRLDLGRYPTQEEGLELLLLRPALNAENVTVEWRGPYLESALPVDPWGRAYVYEAPQMDGARPRIGTLGADGKVGGAGVNRDLFFGGEP